MTSQNGTHGLKVIALQAENFKRLVAVEIRPEGNLVAITGRNAQGKTSVLDALWACIAGAAVAPAEPVRKGAERAVIRLDLGELVATRTFSAGGTTKLTVETADGVRLASPQTVLDGLIGALTLDPLEFLRMDPKGQFDLLRRFVPGVDFDAIDADAAADYEVRKTVNRQAKEARAAAARIEVPSDTPEVEADETALIAQLETAAQENSILETKRRNRETFAATVRSNREEVDRLNVEIARLTARRDELQTEANEKEAKLAAAPPLPDPIDVSAVRRQLEGAREVNRWIAERRRREEFISQATQLEGESKAITARMDARESAKQAAIAAAALPVGGIGFGDGAVTLNGLPLKQASDAEQLRASVAIAMALNPQLRVVRVRDGSLLDSGSKALLAALADQHDCQVWMECVDESGKVGFVIEDGKVAEAPAVQKPVKSGTPAQAQAHFSAADLI